MNIFRQRYSIAEICRAFGYSRQGYYKRREVEGRRVLRENMIIEKVKEYRKRQPRVGVRKLQRMLKNDRIRLGRDRLFNLLRSRDMLVKRKRNTIRTTYSYHRFYKYRNLIRDLKITLPNQVFVSDITYLDTFMGYCYLSLITDVYSRMIVGYCVSESLSIDGSMKALRMAMKKVAKPKELIHHSDRGIQYCSNRYAGYLNRKGVNISMTEKDHVYENALAERVNGILKDEFLLGERLRSIKVAGIMAKDAIEIYNNERLHTSLDYVTPSEKYAA